MGLPIFRYGCWLLLASLLALAFYIAAADYRALRHHQPDTQALGHAHPAWQPWGGINARRAARTGAGLWLAEPERAESLLRSAAPRYPLDGRQWLDLAQLEMVRYNQPQRLDTLLAMAAAAEPNRKALVWRASQLAIQAGNTDRADQLLRQWQEGQPGLTQRALAIAQRWHDDAERFLDTLLPSFEDDYLVQAMAHARGRQDGDLARAVLTRLQGGMDLDHPLFLELYDFLIDSGRRDEALRLWARYDEHYRPGEIANADFSRPLGSGRGLNWRLGRLPEGVKLTLDHDEHFTAPASLRLGLDGKHNVRLNSPQLLIPLMSGEHYRLSGHWRGERLSTRSLPYLTLVIAGTRNLRIDVPRGNFDWEEWAIEFRVPEQTHHLVLRLQRDSTSAFDRYIEGYLWLDALRLSLLPSQPEPGDDSDQ